MHYITVYLPIFVYLIDLKLLVTYSGNQDTAYHRFKKKKHYIRNP